MDLSIYIHKDRDGAAPYYRLSTAYKDDKGMTIFWLENEGGEGLELSERNLFDILHEHWMKEF